MPRGDQQADERHVTVLAEGVGADGAASVIDGAGEVACPVLQRGQLVQGPEVRIQQALSLAEDPVFGAAGQQLAVNLIHGFNQPARPLLVGHCRARDL